MYKYVSDVSNISHYVIKNFLENFNVAVDCTLGNGYDTDFLSELFSKVYAFDIQACAIEQYKKKNKENVILIEDSHHKLNDYINEEVDCIIYNLGFLPGGDKNITTHCESTIVSVKEGLDLLRNGGFMLIAIYRGHEEGKKEEGALLELLKNLPKNKYGVMMHSFFNRKNDPPLLAVIEKK